MIVDLKGQLAIVHPRTGRVMGSEDQEGHRAWRNLSRFPDNPYLHRIAGRTGGQRARTKDLAELRGSPVLVAGELVVLRRTRLRRLRRRACGRPGWAIRRTSSSQLGALLRLGHRQLLGHLAQDSRWAAAW
jgi:hypothetical protein